MASTVSGEDAERFVVELLSQDYQDGRRAAESIAATIRLLDDARTRVAHQLHCRDDDVHDAKDLSPNTSRCPSFCELFQGQAGRQSWQIDS